MPRPTPAWPVALLCSLCLLLLVAVPAAAQPGLTPGAGVSVDAEGVVSVRELATDRRGLQRRGRAWEALNDEAGLVFVSLPRVFAQARAALEAGGPVPDELLYLGGLLQVRYIIIDEAGGGVVLAGPGDTIDASDPWRPVGESTGRPVMRLEDLVIALRTFGPYPAPHLSGGRRWGGVFGCSIDMPEGAQQRFVDALNQAQREGLSRAQKQRRMAEAVGPQAVRFWGVEDDTRFAYTLLEADIRMKRLALGLDDSPVRGLPAAVSGDDHRYTRCWFHPAYDPIKVSADGQVYELTGPRLALSTSRSRTDNDEAASAGAQRFAERANDRMDALCQHIPAWADLANAIDLAVVATLIRTDRLDEQIGWNLAWARDPDGYPVAELPTPEHVETLVVALRGGYAAGGVVVSTGELVGVSNREALEDEPSYDAPEDDVAAVWRNSLDE